jgi:hypothetical protein
MNQRKQRNAHDPFLPNLVPPSSPPTTYLLPIRNAMHVTARIENTTTLNPREPDGT